MDSSQLSLMRWLPTDIQQLLQSNEYSCLRLVGCIPAWGQGPFSILPLCSSGLWSYPCTSCEDPITGGGTGSGPHHHLRTLLENLFSEASDQGSATPASGLLPPLASWCWAHSCFPLSLHPHACLTPSYLPAFAHAHFPCLGCPAFSSKAFPNLETVA